MCRFFPFVPLSKSPSDAVILVGVLRLVRWIRGFGRACALVWILSGFGVTVRFLEGLVLRIGGGFAPSICSPEALAF